MGYLTIRQRTKIPTYWKSAHIITGLLDFDGDRCTRCGICARVCPARSIMMPDKSDRESLPFLEVIGDGITNCIACGCCLAACPREAIAIKRTFRAKYFFHRLAQVPEARPPRRY